MNLNKTNEKIWKCECGEATATISTDEFGVLEVKTENTKLHLSMADSYATCNDCGRLVTRII